MFYVKSQYFSSRLSDTNIIFEVDNVANEIRSCNVNPRDDYYVNSPQIKQIIKTLKNKKSSGIDRISIQSLKNLSNKSIKYLTNLFNICFKLCYLLKYWIISKTIPIIKSDKPPDSPHSYRPISLLPSISKILEKF